VERTNRQVLFGALALAMFSIACGEEDDITLPPLPQAIGIRIEGPAEVNLPASTQFRAFQTWSDGSSIDVTTSAQWTSSNPSVMSVVGGLATGSATATVDLTVRYLQHSQRKALFVVPATPEWSGTFDLTVGGGPCSGSMPADLRQRTYVATVEQSRVYLIVTIPNVGVFGGQIFNPEVRFDLSNGGTNRTRGTRRITHTTSSPASRGGMFGYANAAYSEPPPRLFERLPDGRRVAISGFAFTTASAGGFVGTLNGTLALMDPTNVQTATCFSTSHTFSLTRR
jgi:hypothetical protein